MILINWLNPECLPSKQKAVGLTPEPHKIIPSSHSTFRSDRKEDQKVKAILATWQIQDQFEAHETLPQVISDPVL